MHYYNNLELVGTIIEDPQFEYECLGESFYRSKIKIKRLSDNCDELPIIYSERVTGDIFSGSKVRIIGEFRSRNIMANGKSKLDLYVFAKQVDLADDLPDLNHIEVEGYFCKEPNYRLTPLNREICDILVAVNRRKNKSDYLPGIVWGRNANFCKNLPLGTKVTLGGRVQSRIYYKKDMKTEALIPHLAYEISCSSIQVVRGEE